MNDRADLPTLLDAATRGESAAWQQLVQLLYPDLKRLAHRSLSMKQGNTLNTTALVHECYLRLATAAGAPRERGHLLSLAVRIMQQVLIDHARERLALKRGGGRAAATLEDGMLVDEGQFQLLVDIDDALATLQRQEPRQAQVFQCRYFGGLNDADTAEALGISPRTVHRDWDAARSWLAGHLNHRAGS